MFPLSESLIRSRPYINALSRRLARFGISRRIESVEPVILADEERGEIIPVVALPNQKERVTATIANHRLQDHLRYFDGGQITHSAVMRIVVEDALVFGNGYATSGATRNRWGPLPHRSILSDAIWAVERATYCLEDRAYHFFGHWLRTFAQCLLAEKNEPLLHPPSQNWPDAECYEGLLGMPSARYALARVSQMTTFVDFGQGSHKAERYRSLRRRLRSAMECKPDRFKAVYLRRGQTGAQRMIENEAALIAALSHEGVEIVDLEEHSGLDLIERLYNADVAITIEGSHSDHLHLLQKPGGLLLILNPCDHFNTSQFAVASAYGNVAATVVLESTGRAGTYRVDFREVLKTIEIGLSQTKNNVLS